MNVLGNLLFSANPKAVLSDDKLADVMIEKMGKDVVLTDSQKLVMKKRYKKYISNVQNANGVNNTEEKKIRKKRETIQFESSFDSILTPSQNQQLKLKAKERELAK